MTLKVFHSRRIWYKVIYEKMGLSASWSVSWRCQYYQQASSLLDGCSIGLVLLQQMLYYQESWYSSQVDVVCLCPFVSVCLVSCSVTCSFSSSERYCGASPWRTLKVRSRILYWIRCSTGSQWSVSSKTVSMSSDGGVNVSILAAILNIFWSRWCWPSVTPYSVALQ